MEINFSKLSTLSTTTYFIHFTNSTSVVVPDTVKELKIKLPELSCVNVVLPFPTLLDVLL